MTNGHAHNLKVCYVRLIGAIAAQAQADQLRERGGLAYEIAGDLAAFEARRFAAACYALATTPKEF